MAEATANASSHRSSGVTLGRAGGPLVKVLKGTPDREAGPTTAPGAPGKPARWTSGAKMGVGAALGPASPVWFTLCQGIITEVFYPGVDTASTRNLELIVARNREFVSSEARDTRVEVGCAEPGVPAYRVINTSTQGHYRIEKEILADPRRPVILQRTQFVPLEGQPAEYCLYVMLVSRIGNQGAENTAWVGEYKGQPMLFAERDGLTLALACSVPWKKCSVGFVGVSDGWQDLSRHKQMTWSYDRAESGNVALTAEIDHTADAGWFVLALAFGHEQAEAGQRARASLLQGFKQARAEYVEAWSKWQKTLLPLPESPAPSPDLYRTSAMVIRVHEAKDFPGAIIASLAIPWGSARGDQEMGYHLIWPRDMIETVGGLLAIERHEDARRVLFYLNVIQEADGHWPQNMFLDGRPCWKGTQLDETAFVISLVGLARQRGAINDADLKFFWPMIRRAAGFLVRHGPVTPMDRWEESPGYYASTMALEIPALLVAAELADAQGEPALGAFLRETADAWNDAIDRLIYVRNTELAHRAGVTGYYARCALPDQPRARRPADGTTTLANYPPGQGHIAVSELVSPDALALVRCGLRAANDPRILNTVKVIDLLCKVDTPRGPGWHRYNGDGYGEHADGSPFDGTGIGRAWPLLTGERAHYELAAGRTAEAERLLRTMEAFAGDTGLLPEQVWDTADIPEKGLIFGRPSGSAMPLVWAHAEYVKLRRSLHDGHVFDLLPLAVKRYVIEKTHSRHVCWRRDRAWRSMPPGKCLRLEFAEAAVVRWSADDWHTSREIHTKDTGLGLHIADLPTEDLPVGSVVIFRAQPSKKQEDFRIVVEQDG